MNMKTVGQVTMIELIADTLEADTIYSAMIAAGEAGDTEGVKVCEVALWADTHKERLTAKRIIAGWIDDSLAQQ